MKTKRTVVMVAVILAGFFSTHALAQQNLDALMKKCESMDNVDMDVVQQRNPSTKKITQVIKNINIKNNKALVDDFLKAFQADRENAIQAIDSKKDGKMVPSYYQFQIGKKNVSYSITVNKEGVNASVAMIQNGE